MVKTTSYIVLGLWTILEFGSGITVSSLITVYEFNLIRYGLKILFRSAHTNQIETVLEVDACLASD